MKRLIKNGYVISPETDINRPADILIDGGRIAAVGYGIEDKEAESLDKWFVISSG